MMADLIFSQIPSIVLEKLEASNKQTHPKLTPKKKKVRFQEVYSDEHYEPLSPPTTPSEKETADAIIQTDEIKKPQLEDTASQTDLWCSYDELVSQAQANALCGYKPMYSIPKPEGQQPPLKIGLALPKGKKRKVFYPDEEENREVSISIKKEDDDD